MYGPQDHCTNFMASCNLFSLQLPEGFKCLICSCYILFEALGGASTLIRLLTLFLPGTPIPVWSVRPAVDFTPLPLLRHLNTRPHSWSFLFLVHQSHSCLRAVQLGFPLPETPFPALHSFSFLASRSVRMASRRVTCLILPSWCRFPATQPVHLTDVTVHLTDVTVI